MKKDIVEKTKLSNKRDLTALEEKAIARQKHKDAVNSHPIFRTRETDGKETIELALDENLEHTDSVNLLSARIMEVTGSSDSTVGVHFLTILGKAMIPAKANLREFSSQIGTIAKTMQALAPQDEYEGQLISQLVILHEHAIEWLGKAMRTERVDFANVYLNGASKLLTRHHETLEALLKYRRKGEQRVHVEHVHVHGGGQAIVGNVSTGGGMKPIIEEGPHAKV